MKKWEVPRMTEQDAGIYENTCPLIKGIGGHMRIRCSDFLVNELRLDNTIVTFHDDDDMLGSRTSDEKEKNTSCTGHRTAERAFECPCCLSRGDDGEEKCVLQFTLVKSKMSTVAAVHTISRLTGVRPSSISYAGLKDASAITTQEVTMGDDPPVQILDALRMDNVRLGRFKYVQKRLWPGRSLGNHFQIIVRGASATRLHVKLAVEQLAQKGFVNYFGLQRFSGTATRFDRVGKMYMHKKYVEAVDAMLGPPPWGCQSGTELAARNAWMHARNARSALQQMPRCLNFERQILEGLCRAPAVTLEERCRLAFLSTPYPERQLCVNAYFSKLWNRAASERIRIGRDRVLLGDVVRCESSTAECRDNGRKWYEYHIVTAEDLERGHLGIEDVVLPLPGTESIYPTHMVGQFMQQFLKYEGITMSSYTLDKGFGTDDKHTMYGAYRPVVQMPIGQSIRWKAIRFRRHAASLFPAWTNSPAAFPPQQRDIVKLLAANVKHRELDLGRYKEQSAAQFDGADAAGSNKRGIDAPFVALCFRFSLPPGTYATMLFRELLKSARGDTTGPRLCRHIKFDEDNEQNTPPASFGVRCEEEAHDMMDI